MKPIKPILLGVNIDHVATLRQARLATYPDILEAMHAVEKGGADGITVHLREDRRHIQEEDVWRIRETQTTRLNLEMAVTAQMIEFAIQLKPAHVCLVPEKRQELTTEGGLNLLADPYKMKEAVTALRDEGMQVSLFIDPDEHQIAAAVETGTKVIEIHTGAYADAKDEAREAHELTRIQQSALKAAEAGLMVNAGHGLNCQNTAAIATIPVINELNIGHAIVARAIMVGLEQAVREIKAVMLAAR